MKKSMIYTKSGDKGQTCLVGGKRVSKASPRLEAYGCTDELSALIGLLRSHLNETDCESAQLLTVQQNLFCIGSYLATDQQQTALRAQSILAQSQVENLEIWIDEVDSQLPPLKSFIIPGGTREAAICHICRTVCRRTERKILQLHTEYQTDETILAYMNRLSDYLFVLARKMNLLKKNEEIYWNNTCK